MAECCAAIGGAGAGGSIRIEGDEITLSNVSAAGGTTGLDGGAGRVALYYYTDLHHNGFTPDYTEYLGTSLTPTATFTPTQTPLVQAPEPTQSNWVNIPYTYGLSHPHAVTAAGDNTYAYDANGNMTCRVEDGAIYVQGYNTENRLSVVTKYASGDCAAPADIVADWDFSYDGDGSQVSQIYTPYEGGLPQGDTLTAYFMGGAYEVSGTLQGESFSQTNELRYYAIAGMIVAMRDSSGLKYLLTDHLGSVVAVADSDGTLISQQRYLPFGALRDNVAGSPRITQTDLSYTGQRAVDGLGLMDYRARFYDATIARFVQPDSIIPSYANPQALNRFSYVLGNPVLLNDPSGHREACGAYTRSCKDDQPVPPPEDDAGVDASGDGDPYCLVNPNDCNSGYDNGAQDGQAGQDPASGRRCYDFSGNYAYCNDYVSGALGLDLPTLAMLLGLALSAFGPTAEIGVPLGLGGAAFEACAYTGNPLCIAIKLTSVNLTGTLDSQGNLYLGPQLSIGRSLLPFIATGGSVGTYFSQHPLNEAEMRNAIQGFSVNAGSMATGGVIYSPLAKVNQVGFYYPIPPLEVASASIQLNFWVHDFSP